MASSSLQLPQRACLAQRSVHVRGLAACSHEHLHCHFTLPMPASLFVVTGRILGSRRGQLNRFASSTTRPLWKPRARGHENFSSIPNLLPVHCHFLIRLVVMSSQWYCTSVPPPLTPATDTHRDTHAQARASFSPAPTPATHIHTQAFHQHRLLLQTCTPPPTTSRDTGHSLAIPLINIV